jgi:predicted porin
VTYMRQDDRVNSERNANLYKLGASYLLSRTTSVYSFAGYVKNDRLAALGLQNIAPTGVVGSNQLGIAIGIQHLF